MRRVLLLVALSAVVACAARPLPGSVSALRRTAVDGGEVVDEIVTVQVGDGVTQPYLLTTLGDAPRVVAILFSGGEGVVGLPADVRELRRGSNFLVRTRGLFRDPEVAVAVVDVPSNRQGGMDDAFRSGPQHARDVRAVVRDLRRRFGGAKLFLVGTSRGTVSAAHLGRALGREVDGVVLTSTVFAATARAVGLSDFDFRSIPAPLLFVHHAEDGCWVCPYGEARVVGRTYPLVTVHGGKPAESLPCEPLSAHGYFGKEAETVAAIKSWMLGRPFPNMIE
jgi:hypothetical protein